jgi:hypothetical protein
MCRFVLKENQQVIPIGDSWHTATTGLDGRIEKPLIVGKSTTIRIYSDSTWKRTEGISSEIAVTVNRVLNVTAPGTVKVTEPVVITGKYPSSKFWLLYPS